MNQIYFDNSATTPVDPAVLEAMLPYYKDEFGNANSIHSYGQNAMTAVDESRSTIAQHLGCKSKEVIFTSGATESNNIAIQGVVNLLLDKKQPLHIITSTIEHPSVMEVFKALEKKENVEVSYIKVDSQGLIDLEQLEKEIHDNTVLVSIMYANNEVGSIQPVENISEIIKATREKRSEEDLPIYYHVDAVQAFNYLEIDVRKSGIDALSFSGHKIYGPKGIGALYLSENMKIKPLNYGGHQEFNVRPGTLNVPSIVGIGKAVQLVGDQQRDNFLKIKKVKEKLVKELKKFEDFKFNGPEDDRQLPNIINISFYKAEGESVLMMLDLEKISISTGSACSSGSLEPSPILTAMGVRPEWSHGSLRISLGKFNSESEVASFIKSLEIIINKLRKMAP